MHKSGQDRRQFLRHPIQVPIRLRVARHTEAKRSQCRDLSLGGLNFSWPKKLLRGTILDITIPVREKLFELRGKVVFCKEDRKTAYYRTGVSFIDFPSAFKARLAEEVLQIMEFRRTIFRESGQEISEEEAASRWVREHAAEFPELT